MNLDGLRVNHAGLDTAAEDLYRTVKDIDDRLNRLEQELAPLRSDWTGNAQQAYSDRQGQVGQRDRGDAQPARRDQQDGHAVERRVQGRRPARRRVLRHLSRRPHAARGRRRHRPPAALARSVSTSEGEATMSQAARRTSGLVRVTVASGTRRVDLVLPGAVPVAELVPELARSVGLLDAATVYGGYRLVTAEGRELAGDAGLIIQGVEDGGLLTVTAGVDDPPPRVYDDVVEAMADVVERDLEPWAPASGRRTALVAAGLLMAPRRAWRC